MIKTLKYLNLIMFVIMVAINALANTMPLGHGNTESISNKYPNLFTPAPITFSILGLIYLLTGFLSFISLDYSVTSGLRIRLKW